MRLPARIRPRLAPTVDAVWRRHPHARLAVVVLGSYNVALGVVLALGGPARVSTASFDTIRQLGGPVVWGCGVAVVGLLIFGSALVSRRGVAYSLGAAALVHLFLAGGFLVAAIDLPDAALTGPFTYTALAACHAVQCVLHRRPVPLAR